MSTVFHLHCETCEEFGPDLKRQPGGVSLLPTGLGSLPNGDADVVWNDFLIKHDWHDLSLVHE